MGVATDKAYVARQTPFRAAEVARYLFAMGLVTDGKNAEMETGARVGLSLARRFWPSAQWSQIKLASAKGADNSCAEIIWCEFEKYCSCFNEGIRRRYIPNNLRAERDCARIADIKQLQGLPAQAAAAAHSVSDNQLLKRRRITPVIRPYPADRRPALEAAPGVAKPSPPLAGTYAQSPVYGIEEAEAGEEDEDWNEAEEEEEEEETQQETEEEEVFSSSSSEDVTFVPAANNDNATQHLSSYTIKQIPDYQLCG